MFSKQDIVMGFGVFERSKNDGRLPCRLFVPKNIEKGKKYPLILHFHGAGSVGSDGAKHITDGKGATFATDEMQAKNPCFILALQCPAGRRWVDTDWTLPKHEQQPVTPEMKDALETLDEVILKYPVDADRIYLTGQSMGGFAVWDALCRRPGFFAAAVAVCGGADTSKAALIKDTPVWAFHGSEDGVVTPGRSRDMVEALKKAGGKPIYTEYKGVAHDSWVNAYSEKDLPSWLFSHKRRR